MNIFERASRLRLRFHTSRGVVGVESLWIMKLEYLDNLYQELKLDVDKVKNGSLLSNNSVHDVVILQMDILKYIVEVRMKEQHEKEMKKIRMQKKEELHRVLAEVESSEIRNKSKEEIQKMIADLSD